MHKNHNKEHNEKLIFIKIKSETKKSVHNVENYNKIIMLIHLLLFYAIIILKINI